MPERSPIARAVVVIPTYNEAGNVGRLIDALCTQVFPRIGGFETHILIVDGNSPDGTANIVEQKAKQYENRIHLIRESGKNGIGAAYMNGFSFALNELRADVVIEFDADFQHPPVSVNALIAKINEGYDYVLGSRTIRGGSEPHGRKLWRLFLSGFGGWLARFILFFPGKNFNLVTDPTTGLRAMRVKGILDKLNLDPEHLYSKKFGYKVQLLSETLATGAHYAEVPLNFQNRASGDSKFEWGTTWDILASCVRTRMHVKSNR